MNIENRELSQKLVDTIEFLKQSISKISVYDLNYYSMTELYCNIAKKINELIEMYHEFGVSISEEIIKQNECLHYLLNDGLNTEVVKKINQMVDDRTMDTIINHNIFNDLNSQIKDKASKQELEVEKARINNLTTLAEGSTTGDVELIDARVGQDGVTYDNLGNAIRSQFAEINKLKNVNGISSKQINGENFVNIEIKNNGYLNKVSTIFDLDKNITIDNNYSYALVNLNSCYSGEILEFTCNSNLNANVLFYFDSNGNFLGNMWITKITWKQEDTITYNSSTNIAKMDIYNFCEKYSARYVVINFMSSDTNVLKHYINKKHLKWLEIKKEQLPKEVIRNTFFTQNINLPQKIVCMIGKEFNIYNSSIIATNRILNNYVITWSFNGYGGIKLDNGYRITPTQTGTYTLTIRLNLEDDYGNLISYYNKSCTVEVIEDKAITDNYNVMFIGDSRTNNGVLSDTVKVDIPNITLIGTRKGTYGNNDTNNIEGRNGWKAEHYCYHNAVNGLDNPFYNANNPKSIPSNQYSSSLLTSYFDFGYYCTNNNITKIDVVNILLGTNDNYSADSIRYIKAMVDSIHEYDNNIKIYVMHEYVSPLSHFPSSYYNCHQRRAWQFKYFEYIENIFGNLDYVEVLPTHLVVDNEHDFPYEEQQISNRITLTERRCTDNYHLINDGYKKLSDVFETYFKKDFSL